MRTGTRTNNHHAGRRKENMRSVSSLFNTHKVSAGILSPVFGTAPKYVGQQEIMQSQATGKMMTCENRLVRKKEAKRRQNMINS